MSAQGARPYRRDIESHDGPEGTMHPNSHLHRAIARDTESRRIAEARNASIGAARRRQLTHSQESPAQGFFSRLMAATLRPGT